MRIVGSRKFFDFGLQACIALRVVSDDEISADGCLLKLNRTADTGVAKEIKVRRQVSLNSIRKTLPRDVNFEFLCECHY